MQPFHVVLPALHFCPSAAPHGADLLPSPRSTRVRAWAAATVPQVYGTPAGPAMQLLDGVVRVAMVCLVAFPGEVQLHTQVSQPCA